MTIFSKLLAPAGVALCALAALPAQAQVEGRIATVDISRAVLGTTAFQTAYEQVNTTYAQQNELRRTKATERQTLLATFDSNGDKQVDDAELAAKQKTPQFTQLQTLEQEIQALSNQIDAARIYAVEQVIVQYGPALTEVTTRQQIKLVVDPATLLFAAPEADITQQITTALNAKVPSVGIVPPQGWQPARESVQIYQEIQQRLLTAQMLQQRQQQQQQYQLRQRHQLPLKLLLLLLLLKHQQLLLRQQHLLKQQPLRLILRATTQKLLKEKNKNSWIKLKQQVFQMKQYLDPV